MIYLLASIAATIAALTGLGLYLESAYPTESSVGAFTSYPSDPSLVEQSLYAPRPDELERIVMSRTPFLELNSAPLFNATGQPFIRGSDGVNLGYRLNRPRGSSQAALQSEYLISELPTLASKKNAPRTCKVTVGRETMTCS